MYKSALIIQGVLLLFVILGLALIVMPARVDRIQKEILRVARVISSENANRLLSDRGIMQSRIAGTVYVALCILLLANMHFQVGRFSSPALPVWTSGAPHGAALEQRIRGIVQPAMSTRAGLVVAAIADEEQVVAGYGRSDLSFDVAPSGDSSFELGSISKVLTAALLASEMAQGKVSLDTPVATLLPPNTVPPDSPAQRITLRHLVTHTAGLPRTPAHTFTLPQLWRTVTAGDTYRYYTDDDVLGPLASPSASGIGERFAYSNVGFGILGWVLSRHIGMDYEGAVRARLAQPLGMRDTGVALDTTQRTRMARGYRTDLNLGPLYVAQAAAPWEFRDSMAGAGGLRSTGNDMLTFLAANMGRQKTELTSILQQTHSVLFTQGETQIGMAWLRAHLPKSGEVIIWHNGETGGYATFIGFTADYRFGVVVFANSTDSVDGLGNAILDALVLGP